MVIYLIVRTREKTAGHVGCVGSYSLLLGSHVLIDDQRIDGDLVVEAATSDNITRRSKRAGHDPSGWHRDCMLFVGCECVPDNKFSILEMNIR